MSVRPRIVLGACAVLIAAPALLFAKAWNNGDLGNAWRSMGVAPKLGVPLLLLGLVPFARGVVAVSQTHSSPAGRNARVVTNLWISLASLVAGVGLLQLAWYGLFDGVDCAGIGCNRAFVELRSGVVLFLSLTAIPVAALGIWLEIARDGRGAA